MLDTDVRDLIDTGFNLLVRDRGFSTIDMEERASSLLMLVAKLAQVNNELQYKRIEALSIERASFGVTLSKADGKNITERKILTDANDDYRKTKITLETLDADISYIKTIIDVFNNAHIMWRQFSKSEY